MCCIDGLHPQRFIDYQLILSHARRQFKYAVAEMNRWFNDAGLAQHPDKTFIGRIERGFDWLGYRFGKEGLCGIAAPSLERFAAKLRRLLEQARRCHASYEA